MSTEAKASTVGSNLRQASGLGRCFRGVDAIRGASPDAKGSGARSGGLAVLLLAVVAAAFLVMSTTASAALPVTFAESGTDAGQIDGPVGIAVDPVGGYVYIADNNNFRLDKFDAEGNFLMAWGIAVADPDTLTFQTCGPEASPPTTRCFKGKGNSDLGPGSGIPRAMAVDQASGDVYVREAFRVKRYTSTGELLLMFGKNVNVTPGTPHPNLCTAADIGAGDICKWGEEGAEPGALEFDRGTLAVDPTGDVWVGGDDRLQRFNPDGSFDSQIELPGAGGTESLALDAAGNFYVRSANFAGIRKLEAGTGALLQTFDAGGQPLSVTLDPAGNVYVGDKTSPYRFLVFNPAGEQISQFGVGQVIGVPGEQFRGANGIAFGPATESLYVISPGSSSAPSAAQIFSLPDPGPIVLGGPAEEVLPTTATLTGTVNPENDATSYFFEYGTDQSYGQSTPVTPLGVSGFEEEEVEAAIDQLIPDTPYHFRLVATNHCNEAEPAEECTTRGEDATFTTPPPILINGQWATNVTSNSATLNAQLDPLGVQASWWVEYGADESYGSTTPEQSLGSGFGDVPVHLDLEGLAAGSTYHYRFAARDERDGNVYTVHGGDRSFTTQLSGLGFELADDRAWEMVSPADKFGASLFSESNGLIQSSVDGDAITYLSTGSIEADPEGNRSLEASTVLSRRGMAGWRSKDITPPNDRVTQLSIGNASEYKLFSPDFSRALLEPRSGTPLSPEASERAPYLRANTEPGIFTPLVTAKEGFANVPLGTKFGGSEFGESSLVRLDGAAPDLDHVILRSPVPLVEGLPEGFPVLYHWAGGQIEPLSVLPSDEGGGIVSAHTVGSGSGSIRHAVSDDGSRVFWSTGEFSTSINALTALYMRDTVADQTVRIDVPELDATGTGTVRPTFQGASADGSVVYFTDTQRLTANASLEGADLYRCELPLGGSPSQCATLTDVSAAAEGSGENAEVLGFLPALSEDGTRIYFVAEGVLDSGANELGEVAVSGEPNLYAWDKAGGARFIATLSREDHRTWGLAHAGEWGWGAALTATGSSTGRYLSFMSQRSLTGYDNKDAASGEPAQEVFRYDALTDRLICASCNPSGARPLAPLFQIDLQALLVDPGRLWLDRRVAAIVPSAADFTGAATLYRSRAVSDNGRVFFNAVDALVPSDANRRWDVYEYEPYGVGDCGASSGGPSSARASGGCVSLISSGTGEENAAFYDASAGGDDVFFSTPAQLSVLDGDQEYDVYDARVDGVAATQPVVTECQGEACQPAAQAPNDPTPASAAFKGPANEPVVRKRCPKGRHRMRRHGKVRCVARNRHKRAGQHKQAGKSGRAHR